MVETVPLAREDSTAVTVGVPVPQPTEDKPGSGEAWAFALHAMRCPGRDCEIYGELLADFMRAVELDG